MAMKFEVGSFWKRRDGLKAEIIANDLTGQYTTAYKIKYKQGTVLIEEVSEYGEWEIDRISDSDLVEPWTDKKKVKLTRYLMKEYSRDLDREVVYLTLYLSYEPLYGEIIKEHDSIEVEYEADNA